MKLFILGATGPTGLQIVRQALAQGHQVTAFVRDPARLPYTDKNLGVATGSLPGEALVRASSLDWTIAYPTLLTNGPRTGNYRAAERLELKGMPRISRADVADFVLRQLDDRAFLKKGAVISN